MGFCGKDLPVGCPKITKGMAVLLLIRDGLPQAKAWSFPAVANGKCHDLACPSAHRCPHPSGVIFFPHTTPHLIVLKNVAGRRRQERLFHLRQLLNRGADPSSTCLASDVEDALNSTQPATFQAGPSHRLFVRIPIRLLWFQDPVRTTILPMVLSRSTTVRPISDAMCPSTDATVERHRFLNHALYHSSSLTT
jgi:hypothetical protein